MVNLIGYTILTILVIADYYAIKSIIKEYKRLQKAKESARIWGVKL